MLIEEIRQRKKEFLLLIVRKGYELSFRLTCLIFLGEVLKVTSPMGTVILDLFLEDTPENHL